MRGRPTSSSSGVSFAAQMYVRLALVSLLVLSTLSTTTLSTLASANPAISSINDRSLSERSLAVGDFQELNEVLANAAFQLRSMSLTESGTTLSLSNIVCRNVNIGDVQLRSRASSPLITDLSIQVIDLDMTCRAEYYYNGGFLLKGRGSVQVISRDNDVVLDSSVSAPGTGLAPDYITINQCSPDVNINDIDFDGGFMSWVLNLIQRLARGIMENLVEEMLCGELEEAIINAEEILSSIEAKLEEYKLSPGELDPLKAEQYLLQGSSASVSRSAQSGINLLDFQNPESNVGQWVKDMLNRGTAYLSEVVEDPSNPGRPTDLRANQLIRQFILDEDRGLVVNASASWLPNASDILFYSHNLLMETTIRLDQVRLVGLDTLKQFDPINIISNYTLESQIAWDYLAFDIDATMEIMPSSLEGAIVESGNNNVGITERISVSMGLGDLGARVALLSAINQDLFEEIKVGSLLQVENLMPCLVSTIFQTSISTLSVEAGDVFKPFLSGFVSVGLDQLFGSILGAGFLMYENIVLERTPGIFQRDVRELANERFVQDFLRNSSSCPPFKATSLPTDMVDFRDLLLDPIEALNRGGTGDERYGNLFSSFLGPNLDKQVMQVDKFNERFVRPLTEAQSGVKGAFFFDDAVLNFQSLAPTPLYDAAVFYVSDLEIHNLDTVVGPLNVLDARDWNLLYNTLTFEDDSRPLTVKFSVLLAVGGSTSPLSMKNQMDITVKIPSSTASVGMLASIREDDLLNFPLADVTNPYCWLAALGRNSDAGKRQLDLETLSLFASSFTLDAECVACSSPAAPFLGQLLRDLQNYGFQFWFKDKIVDFVEEVLWDLWHNFDMEAVLEDAPLLCPHARDYNSQAEFPLVNLPTIGMLSPDAMETLLAVGVVALQTILIVVAKNHIASPQPATDQIVEVPQNMSIVDWTNLSAEMGSWADLGFQEFRKYLMEPTKSGSKSDATVSPRVVSIFKEYALDEEGSYKMNVDTEFEALGFEVGVSQVEILGLGTVSDVDILLETGPYTLGNHFAFDELTLVVRGNVTMAGQTKDMIMTYKARNVRVYLDMLVVMNLDVLREIRIGSIFDTDDLFPCLLSGLEKMQLHTVFTTIESIDDPKIDGVFSVQYRDALDFILESMMEDYRSDVLVAAPIFFETTFKEMINAWIPNAMTSIQKFCPPPKKYPSDGLVDFRDLLLSPPIAKSLGGSGALPYGNLFQNLYDLLVDNVLRNNASNRPIVNDIFSYLTEKQSNISGLFEFDTDTIATEATFSIAGLDADIGLRVFDVTISDIDSVGDPLELLRPVNGEAHVVNNTISFGVDSTPVSLAGTILLSISDGVEMNIRNSVRVALSMQDVVAMAELLLKISEEKFAKFPLRDLNNINCWLATLLAQSPEEGVAFRGIGINEYSLQIGGFDFDMSCISCTSPDFDKLLLSLYDFENVTDLESALQDQAKTLLDTDFFPVLLDQIVKDSAKRCPHHPKYDPDAQPVSFLSNPGKSLGFLKAATAGASSPYFNVFNALLALSLFLFGILARRYVKKRNRSWIESLSREGRTLLDQQQEKDLHMQMMLNATTSSLVTSKDLSRRVRYGVPLALLMNLVLYLVGHFGTLSTVNVDASIAGEEFTIYEFMVFRFFESTGATFRNGGAEMAVLLWLFTGVWPYMKIMLSLLLWVLPPQRLCVKRRGQGLLWIDALAKLSIVDVATVLLAVAVLLVFVGGPDKSLDSPDPLLYAFKAIVIPRAGFYCLLIGQRMSRVSSRYLLEKHEHVMKEATESIAARAKSFNSESGDDSAILNQLQDDSENSDEDVKSEIQSLVLGFNAASENSDGDEEMSSSSASSIHFRSLEKLKELSIERLPSDDECALKTPLDSDFQWGALGVTFGGAFIVIVFIIGCIFAPAISFDASSIAGLAVESQMTYEDVVNQYGVFVVASSILVNARFVMTARADYVGLGFLLFGGIVSIALVFFLQAYQFVKRKLRERQLGPVIPTFGHKGCGFPFYFRLYKWKHMEIYLISFAIGIWQLGSACAYAIQVYCDVLAQGYGIMSYMGVIEDSNAQCILIQTTLPGNLTIIAGSFAMLSIIFFFQAAAQYRKNIAETLRFIDDDDVPRLSLAWSKDKSKNSRYSHLTSSLSMDGLSNRHLPEIPGTPNTQAMTPPGTPQGVCDDDPSCTGRIGNDVANHGTTSPLRSLFYPLLSMRSPSREEISESTPNHLPSRRTTRSSSVRFDLGDADEEGSLQPPIPPRLCAQEAPSTGPTTASPVSDEDVFRLMYRPSPIEDNVLL